MPPPVAASLMEFFNLNAVSTPNATIAPSPVPLFFSDFDPLEMMFADEGVSANNNTASSVHVKMEQFCIAHTPSVQLYTFIIAGVLTGLMCVFGLIGNLLSTIVLIKTQLSVSVNLLLLGLTFCDTIVIFYASLAFVLPPLLGYLGTGFWYTRHVYPLIAPFLLPLGYFGRSGSFYFTVAVTIERYIVVCWPLRARIWCTGRRAIYFTIAVFIFIILYTLPKWFEIESFEIHETHPITNQTSWVCHMVRPTPLSSDSTYQFFYNLLYLIIMAIFPFSILVVLNFLIYKEIKWSNMTRGTITSSQLTENSIAVMLLFVVLVFFVCALPATTLHLLDMFQIIDYHRLAIDISLFLVTTNSCVNFAIYFLCGQRFRTNFILIWNQYCSCCPLKRNLRMASSTTNVNATNLKGTKTECELI